MEQLRADAAGATFAIAVVVVGTPLVAALMMPLVLPAVVVAAALAWRSSP